MAKEYKVEFDSNDENYRMVVIRLDRDYTKHRCGYVGIDPKHSLHGKDYSYRIKVQDPETLKMQPSNPVGTFLAAHTLSENGEVDLSFLADVHGGITYAGGSKEYPVDNDDLWWFGFDAAHLDDNEDGGQSLDYMISECRNLKDFLQKMDGTL